MHRDAGEGEGGLADQLTQYQPGWADYAHHITTSHPRFLDGAASLIHISKIIN
jgi:hypothetical protein